MEATSGLNSDSMAIRIVIAAVICASVLYANAQDLSMTGEAHHVVEKKEGLENARCFIQDRNGFFWIGTKEGIIRYDGHEITRLEDLLTHKSPPLRNITALDLDTCGILWIAGSGRVGRLILSSMILEEIRMVSADSAISRLPDINDLHFYNDRLLVSTYQGFYILSQDSTKVKTWNVSPFHQLTPTANESRFLDSLRSSHPLVSSLKITDSLLHSVRFSVNKSSEFLIVSRSPKMFSGIEVINDMAWIENQSGERVWSKYEEFYFLPFQPTILRLPPGKYTLHGQMKLYDYFHDLLPKYEVGIYEVDAQSAQRFRSMQLDWRNRRSIVENNTGEMLADEQGTVWITGGGGLTSLKFVKGVLVFNVYTPHEGKEFGQHGIHTFTIKPSRANGFWLLGRGYSQLVQLRQGKNIFGQNHIMFYEAESQRFSRLSYDGSDLIADIAEDGDSSLWVLHENGILTRIMFQGDTRSDPQEVDQVDLSSFGRPDKLLIDRSDNLWILTEKQGLIKITRSKRVSSWQWPHDQVLFGKPEKALDEFLLFAGDGSVFRSRINERVLATRMVGALEHPAVDFLRLSDTSAIAATRHGKIYFLDKHLRSEGSVGMERLHVNPRIPIGVTKLVRESEDGVYLCTNQGLFTISVREKNISTNLFDPQPGLVLMVSDVFSYQGKDMAVVNMYAGSKGSSGYVVPVETSGRKKGPISGVYADLGTEINAVVQSSDRILVGSEFGVHEYVPEKDTFLLFTSSGFPPVYNMIADDRGFVWTIGRDGVAGLNVESRKFHTIAELPLPEKKINELPPPLWRHDMAHILLVVNNRLYKLLIDSGQVQEDKPLVHIDNLVVQNRPGKNRKVTPLHNKIVMSPGQNTFTVDFAATNVAFPERAYFSYRLLGYHADWINTSYSEIQFINVPPGDYTLELRVVDGLSTSSTTMLLELRPFWWQTLAARFLFGAALLLTIWWGWYAYSRHNMLRKNLEQEHLEKEKIAIMTQMRSRFFANISHEFRTPLSLISGPIEDRIKAEKDPHERKTLNRVLDQVKRMLKLVNELLDLSKLEVGRLPVAIKTGDIMQNVNSIAESFNEVAAEKGLKYSVIIQRNPVYVEFDAEQIAKILVNLLANAVKFCPGEGKVSLEIGYDDQKQQFCMEVCNDGKAIPEEELSMIFNPFYRASNTEIEGTGIGLTLVKELVENMNGTIDAFSDPVKGNKFRVLLPLSPAKKPEFPTEDIPLGGSIAIREHSGKDQPQTGSYQLLIIEDDEGMRDYVASIFTVAAQPLTAVNGEIGFKLAAELIPDLVICDVMMPGSDGIACCERLKNDPRTDHIPIILLTAKAALADRMNGLRAGADDYITKPFSSEELRIKVNNLINQRNQLKIRFGKHIQATYNDLAIKSADERFLDKAISVVHAQIDNPEFDITQFSSSMNLSRTHLHKKLKVITGQSPSEFIRNLRLQRAAQLLIAGTDQVSLIAYDTGFNNLSYFTRMFKAKYGVSPTEYKRKFLVKS